MPERVAGRPQSEFQRLTRNAVDVGANCPSQPGRGGSRQRNGLDLQKQPVVPLLIAPVAIQPPEKAVVLAGRDSAPTSIDLSNAAAARRAEAVPCIKPPKRDLVRGLHRHRDHMPLTDPHLDANAVATLSEDSRVENFRRKVLRIRLKIPQQVFKIGRGGAGRERRPAPVVQLRPRHVGRILRYQMFDHYLAAPQPSVDPTVRSDSGQKGGSRAVLHRQLRFDPSRVFVESPVGSRCWPLRYAPRGPGDG